MANFFDGWDPVSSVVAVELVPEMGEAVLFRRLGDQVVADRRAFQPYLLLSDARLIRGFPEDLMVVPLQGDASYRTLLLCRDNQQMTHVRKHIARCMKRPLPGEGGPELERAGVVFSVKDPTSAFLCQSGVSCFRDMPFERLRRMQVDIEAYTSRMPGGERYFFPNPRREEDCIIAIGMSDSSGWERCLSGAEMDEATLLREFVQVVQDRDPDVIEVFNAAFDMDYLQTRADLRGVSLTLGREWNGNRPVMERVIRLGRGREYDPVRDAADYSVFGRIVVDLYLSLLRFDQRVRLLPSHKLKECAHYFGLNEDRDRQFVLGDDIASVWDTNPARICAYCLDDVRDTRSLGDRLLPQEFRLAQRLPASLQRVCRLGGVAAVHLLLTRSYLRAAQSMPRGSHLKVNPGAAPARNLTGIWPNVFKLKFPCMSSQCIRRSGARPVGDHLGVFPGGLEEALILANDCRNRLPLTGNSAVLLSEELALEALAESFAQYLGASGMPFNDPAAALEVEKQVAVVMDRANRLLKECPMASRLTVVRSGADHLLVSGGDGFTDGDEQALEIWMRERMEGWWPTRSGRWSKLLSRSSDGFALLGYDGVLTGYGPLRSVVQKRGRHREPMVRELLANSLRLVMEGKTEEMRDGISTVRNRIAQREIEFLDVVCSDVCRESAEEYLELQGQPGYTRRIVQELMLRSDGRFVQGDVINYFIAGSGFERPAYAMAEFAYNWDKDKLNVDYLLNRLDRSLANVLDGIVEESRLGLSG